MQARNREFRRQNAERESGRPDFEVGKAGSNPVSASEKGIQEKNLVSFFVLCDRRVPGAAAPTAAGGRRRKVMQARNREFRRQNAERESGRPDFEVGKAGSNPVSAIKKRDTRENLVSFFMPCDRRVFTDLGIGKKKINRDDWRPAHLQYEGYYQAGQHQGA